MRFHFQVLKSTQIDPATTILGDIMKRKTLNKSTLLTPIAAAVLGLVAHQAVFAQQSDPNEVVVTM